VCIQNLLGFIKPSGRLTSRVKEKAKTKLDSMFSLKQSHSIAEVLWNHGRDWLLIRLTFALLKRSFCRYALILAAPVSDSAKWWSIGAR
jgi:hypothetical protein